MKDRMTNAEFEELLKGFGWDNGLDNFDEAIMELFDEHYPGWPPDRLVNRSYDSIAFSKTVRDGLRLVDKYIRTINELTNKRLLNYRKSGKLAKRRETQKKNKCDLTRQMKMPWQPERPAWDKG